MFTKNFDIFTKMVDLAKKKNLDYIIMYSRHDISHGSYSHSYSFVLSTNLFTVSYEKKFKENEDTAIKDYINHNDCTAVDFDIKIDNNIIELTN